jgi:hypothetical protein
MHVVNRLASVLATGALLLSACGKGADAPAATSDGHAHAPGTQDHDHAPAAETGHGPTVELGQSQHGGHTVRASRDGELKPGGEAPIDVWITGGEPVAAVRFWIGTEDGSGALKAKAALERDNWHTHAEVPEPLPAGSKLWVEIESTTGTIVLAGFDLKA